MALVLVLWVSAAAYTQGGKAGQPASQAASQQDPGNQRKLSSSIQALQLPLLVLRIALLPQFASIVLLLLHIGSVAVRSPTTTGCCASLGVRVKHRTKPLGL